jgi:hypothetical protein
MEKGKIVEDKNGIYSVTVPTSIPSGVQVKVEKKAPKENKKVKKERKVEAKEPKGKAKSIKVLELPLDLEQKLVDNNIKTLGDLLDLTESRLKEMKVDEQEILVIAEQMKKSLI